MVTLRWALSQTLSRGLHALELLADAEAPLTIAELSQSLGVHRSIAYRILRTLEAHSLVMRDDAGPVATAPGLAALARRVSRDLQTAALPELTSLADELSMTAFVAVWDQHNCVTLVTVEPRQSRPESTLARTRGYAVSHDEVIGGVSARPAELGKPSLAGGVCAAGL